MKVDFDLSAGMIDFARRGDLGQSGDGGVGGACAAVDHVVVNEVKVAGLTASDEFIELYNPCVNAVDLTGFSIVYRSAAGTSDVTIVNLTKSIPGGGWLLVAETDCACATMADQTYTTGRLAAAAGGVALRDPAQAVVDSVGYGATATNAFVEGAPAPAPATSSSIARTPNGKDTNHNDADFVATTTPTPKAAN